MCYPSNAVNASWVRGTRRVYHAKWTVSSFDLTHDDQPTDNKSLRQVRNLSQLHSEFQQELMRKQDAASARLTSMKSFSISPGRKGKPKLPDKVTALKNLSRRYLHQPDSQKSRSRSVMRLPSIL